MAESRTIVLSFTPELPCSFAHCEQMTDRGQLSEYVLMPGCATHGYAWECSEQEQLASVARYASWLFDHEGTARVLRTATLAEIPGYAPYEDARSTDLGWLVEWTCADKRKELYITWCVDLLTFEVFQ